MMHHHHHQHHYIIINFTSSSSSSFSSSANSTCDWINPQLNIFEMLFIFCFFLFFIFWFCFRFFLVSSHFLSLSLFTISFSVSPHLFLQFNLQHKNKKYYEIDLRSICCCCCCCSRGRIRGGATQGGRGVGTREATESSNNKCTLNCSASFGCCGVLAPNPSTTWGTCQHTSTNTNTDTFSHTHRRRHTHGRHRQGWHICFNHIK